MPHAAKHRETALAMLAIGLLSGSMLIYEILLTRICSLRLFFHFGYLVISNCLLGLGAGGTLIFLFQAHWRRRPHLWVTLAAVLYLLSLALAYAFMLHFHIPKSVKFSEPEGMARLMAFNLAAAVPFFFSGLAVGMLLAFHARVVNRIYFADLLGAGLGCIVTPLILKSFGAGGCLLALFIAGLGGALAYWPRRGRKPALALGGALILAALCALPWFDQRFPVPGKEALDLTSRVTVNLARGIIYSKWSVNSRIDVMPVPEPQMFCIGTAWEHLPGIPTQYFIAQDGIAGTYIYDYSGHPEGLKLIENSMYSMSMRLKREPRVFIIGVGGGNDLWAAKVNGASSVKAIELNAGILDVHTKVFPNFSGPLITDPRFQLVCNEGRSAISHERGQYDVIQMTGIDTLAALVSGAYILAENYLYTKEAIQTMYDRLAPGGIMQISKLGADMETLRLVSNVWAALAERGVSGLEGSLIGMRTNADAVFSLMVKKGPFTPEEVASTERFTRVNGIEQVYLPGRGLGTILEQFILDPDKALFIRNFPRNISPTTDDRPYFFNYTKWQAPLQTRAYVSEPTCVSQGNPWLILMQLAFSCVLALVFIVLPLQLSARKTTNWRGGGRTLAYFAGLGLGFIGIEIGAIQKLTLFLGLPVYSLSVSLASLLIFTGVGSLVSARFFPPRRGPRILLVPAGISLILLFFILFSQRLIAHFFGQPIPVRIALAVLALAPLGLCLGVPFAFGIRVLGAVNPRLIPWAWAINGCCTVIGSILTVIVSMNLGFYRVLEISAVIYVAAFAAFYGLIPRREEAQAGADEMAPENQEAVA